MKLLFACTLALVACSADDTEGSSSQTSPLPPCQAEGGALPPTASASTVAVVVPLGALTAPAPSGAAEGLDGSLEAARERAVETGTASANRMAAALVPFEVEETLTGVLPPQLLLPSPDCSAPAYLAVQLEGEPMRFTPLTGPDDRRVDTLRN